MRMLLGVEKSNVTDSGPRDGKSVKADVFVRCICDCLDARNETDLGFDGQKRCTSGKMNFAVRSRCLLRGHEPRVYSCSKDVVSVIWGMDEN